MILVVSQQICAPKAVQVLRASIRFSVQRAKAIADGLCPTEMVVANRLAECPRSAVDHDPDPIVLIGLNLDEVIPAPERCEFENAIIPPQGLKAGVT